MEREAGDSKSQSKILVKYCWACNRLDQVKSNYLTLSPSRNCGYPHGQQQRHGYADDMIWRGIGAMQQEVLVVKVIIDNMKTEMNFVKKKMVDQKTGRA